ncbi:hypothetical protein [Sphingobium sp.]|uniref:hypothetical protein n=1 Tax=Sphingobium sp. TaxID=1912891 RepID=UPI0035C69248
MLFLAHRGLWTALDERNSRSALKAAFELGFGVETDIRDFDGRLVISHDMATPDSLPLSVMLADYDTAGRPGPLALNVKADGLTAALIEELDAFAGMRQNAFVFDMSVPDTIQYLGKGLQVFTRHSEYEPLPPLEMQSQGVWMDCFVNAWVDPDAIMERVRKGQKVAIVSPELHKREIYQRFWKILKDWIKKSDFGADILNSNLMLCTDFPREAAEFFKDL